MGDASLKCPFCCDKLFNSKEEIIEHLANILGNISCPICKNKWVSLNQLIQHLSLDDCQPQVPTETITFDTGPESTINDLNSEDSNLVQLPEPKILASDDISNVKTLESFPTIECKEVGVDGSDIGKMYVELLGKQLATPCLQTQELKLVKHNGVSRYVFMVNDDSNMSLNNTVVTKQNHDGTISMTTVKDLKMESDTDTVITQENDLNQDNQEEIYSCNTCGVSFTSVIEHIQNYHNDQEVVVEGPLEDTVNNVVTQEEAPLDNMLSDQIAMDKQTMRRMITDTGDIVEEPTADSMSKELVVTGTNKDPLAIPKEETDKVEPKPKRKRYVQINKFCDSVVKDINPTKDKNNPYHKVVVKEMRTYEGETVRVYNCMVCHVYVTSLDDFKSQPCKQLKYSCTQCSESYHSSKSLYAHMKVHKQKPETGVSDPATLSVPVTFECEVCSTVFTTNKSLKLHRRMHDPIKARPIEPPVETAEGTEVSLDRFHCSVCDKMIPMDYKTIHQNSHKNTTMFNCDICNKKFQSSQYLEMHMNVHAADKVTVNKQDKSLPYTCLYCDRRFARPHEKVKHERIHTGEKPHTCAICGKSFRVSYCLTLHMRTHTGARPYSCQHCGKRFKAHSVYNHHLLTHSEVRAYKCPYCPKAFKTSVQLAGHKNSHTKPFSCQHCNRPFASLYAVRVHTETHARQNNLKFACTLCGASYARAFALKDHIKQVHQQNVIDEKELVTVPGTFDVVG